MGHLSGGCACSDAIEHPTGKNNRNNVSMLITTPLTDTVGAEQQQVIAQEMADGKYDLPTEEEIQESRAAKRSHDSFDGQTFNTLLKYPLQAAPSGEKNTYIPVRQTLIDCGKTFRGAYFKVLIQRQVRLVDGLLLTHDHADAMAGLDDLRDLQRMHMSTGDEGEAAVKEGEVKGHWYIDHYIPTFLSSTTLQSVKNSVVYIYNNSQQLGEAPDSKEGFEQSTATYNANFQSGEGNVISPALQQKIKEQQLSAPNDIGIRRSTALQLFTLSTEKVAKFYCPSLGPNIPIYSVPVEHGKNYISLGFVFGTGVRFVGEENNNHNHNGSCVVYLSDISANTDVSLQFLQSLVKIDVLVVDVLHGSGRSNPVHYCMDEAVELIALLRPKTAFAMGMYCDVEHEEGRLLFQQKVLERLAKEKDRSDKEVLLVDLSYDGMQIQLPQ
ncbi:hypothetical protein AGDE_00813 [Angomonas deanei]|nr:hypothetical protein AGDE_00813 [Angomonas deanei]|eukprot:EPY43110.1 hypothetical protein AGDE_00813 [Angomonas deanei]